MRMVIIGAVKIVMVVIRVVKIGAERYQSWVTIEITIETRTQAFSDTSTNRDACPESWADDGTLNRVYMISSSLRQYFGMRGDIFIHNKMVLFLEHSNTRANITQSLLLRLQRTRKALMPSLLPISLLLPLLIARDGLGKSIPLPYQQVALVSTQLGNAAQKRYRPYLVAWHTRLTAVA